VCRFHSYTASMESDNQTKDIGLRVLARLILRAREHARVKSSASEAKGGGSSPGVELQSRPTDDRTSGGKHHASE